MVKKPRRPNGEETEPYCIYCDTGLVDADVKEDVNDEHGECFYVADCPTCGRTERAPWSMETVRGSIIERMRV